MKNTKRMIGWPGGFALLLAAAFITACSEEEFTREAGTVPGEETLTGVSAELYRPAVGSRIRLSDADATDVLRLRLSQLSVQDVSATLAVDADKLDAYNKERGTEYELFPAENVGLEANGTITVPAGETESPDFTVTLEREGVEKGEYLLPTIIGDLLKEGKMRVEVRKSHDEWFGVTYKEDKPDVVAAIQKLIKDGVYPEKLF